MHMGKFDLILKSNSLIHRDPVVLVATYTHNRSFYFKYHKLLWCQTAWLGLAQSLLPYQDDWNPTSVLQDTDFIHYKGTCLSQHPMDHIYLRTEIPLKSPMVLESAAPDELSYFTQVCFGRFSALVYPCLVFTHKTWNNSIYRLHRWSIRLASKIRQGESKN